MADFNPNPYRGEASIPHVSEEFFKVYFVGAQVMAELLRTLSLLSQTLNDLACHS